MSCMEAGRWNSQPAGLPGGRGGVPGQVAGGAEGERRGAWMKESYRSDQGAVWREVSYSWPREPAPSPTSDYRRAREGPHQIDSFVERSAGGRAGRRHFPCARGILGLELLGEEDLS